MIGISSSTVGGERIRPVHLAHFVLGGIAGIVLSKAYGLCPDSFQRLIKHVLRY